MKVRSLLMIQRPMWEQILWIAEIDTLFVDNLPIGIVYGIVWVKIDSQAVQANSFGIVLIAHFAVAYRFPMNCRSVSIVIFKCQF